MSSDFERRLREARATLPEPDEATTKRARDQSWGAMRRRRPRVRVAALVGAALVLAIALGVGIGALVTPSGTASQGPVGLGFLPEPGWFVLQSGARASTSFPAVAMASSVPFAPDDDVGGPPESSALPYSTLLGLRSGGIVIAATFTPRGVEPDRDILFSKRALPLQLPAVIPRARFGAQLRPEEPLGVYRLDAAINGYNVDLSIYFGTPQPSLALIARAQRQLDHLVVRAERTTAPATRRPALVAAAPQLVDRTLACSTLPSGGVREIEARGNAGVYEYGSRVKWFKLPFAVVATGRAETNLHVLGNSLVWITAGQPVRTTTVDHEDTTASPLAKGTLAINLEQCKSTSAQVPLSAKGLRGGPASQLGESLDCTTPRRVLVRVRARQEAPAALRSRDGFLKLFVPISEASLAARTESGKPLVFATVSRSGPTRLFTARDCSED